MALSMLSSTTSAITTSTTISPRCARSTACVVMRCFRALYFDFHSDMQVPGSRLPKVRAIASEFYDTMPHYNSWWDVLIKFITRDDVGCFSRIMRKPETSKLWHFEQLSKKQKAA